MTKEISRDLAEAVGFYLMNRECANVEDVAHDWKVDEDDLRTLIDRVELDGGYTEDAEAAIADWVQDNMEVK